MLTKTIVFLAALLLWATGLILIGREFTCDFNLYYIAFDDLEDFLHEALDSGKINVGICKEMLLVLEEYKRFYGGI